MEMKSTKDTKKHKCHLDIQKISVYETTKVLGIRIGSKDWSKDYYIGTAGTVTAENIRKYIENQKDVR